MKTKLPLILIVLAVIAAVTFVLYQKNDTEPQATTITEAIYQCDNDKTIAAAYHEGPEAPEPVPGEPPVPTGSVSVSLDGEAAMDLKQTISASGVRYANEDESFVFWNKGDEALIMRNNEMDLEYTNCRSAE